MADNRTAAPLEFHVNRAARDHYQFDEALFSFNGNVIFANFYAARVFAQKINQRRDLVNFPEQAVRASHINALGLIDETAHAMFRAYRERVNPRLLSDALAYLGAQLGPEATANTLRRFVEEFPPLAVYRGELEPAAWLEGSTDGMPHREAALEELLMLWLSNQNPAFEPFRELFNDTPLERTSAYRHTTNGLYSFFADQPAVGPDGTPTKPGAGENIIELLRAPARAAPHSLEGQLEYIRAKWVGVLGVHVYRLLGSLDLIKEEEKPVFLGPGPAEIPVFDFKALAAEGAIPDYPEFERFSDDREWMPRLVLMAKNAYVWLDQLSKRYQQPITRLDQIPDEELDTLARRGITGLWLIGLWERSRASQRIKQIMGNPDAVASAYSLYDYQIAQGLGGEEACANLRERAWQRGIRMASDMVPNHVGIDGRWVLEHPDWFVGLDYPPFPAYTFNGPDLSDNEHVGIFIEDHYYNHSDAAVVFKRVERSTGSTRYIYHGNDGTVIPWNDTAQLNYLHAEVREAVIQTILHVARQFPVIRFDAAMTLAKKHVQRLWFPEPGTGGAIASRADFGLSRAEFDAAMPEEFWREVVDRVAQEAPDTLLLAEAFWLMEGYFVRTLGMHRVYNSAFMHMTRDEDNAKYRQLIKNTLEFDPEILRRYVNFMNNPDEKTAVEQFGKGDKYFGVCTIMVTLPGLPMLGHGQVEGFYEKYGMEYQRAYYDETPDDYLVQRHEREISPLLHRRALFAGVDQFLLYDFFTPDGTVNEDVFAYSNRYGDERSLVVYHNRYAEVRGWVRSSVAFMARSGTGDERALTQRSLAEGLDLPSDPQCFLVFRDNSRNQEYLRNCQELAERGLYVELGAYQYHVFVDMRVVRDDEADHYAQLHAYLGGRGVPSVEEALREIVLQPVRNPFRALVSGESLRALLAAKGDPQTADRRPQTADRSLRASDQEPQATDDEPTTAERPASKRSQLLDDVEQRVVALLQQANTITQSGGDVPLVTANIRHRLAAALDLPLLAARGSAASADYLLSVQQIGNTLDDDPAAWGTLLSWVFAHHLGALGNATQASSQSRGWIDEWLLGRIIGAALGELGHDDAAADRGVALVKLLTSYQDWFTGVESLEASELLTELLSDREVQQLIGVNRYQGVLWFNKESFELLLRWLLVSATVLVTAEQGPALATQSVEAAYMVLQRLSTAAEQSGFQVDRLRALARA